MTDSRYAADKMIIQTTELIIFITPLENGKSYKRGKKPNPQISKFQIPQMSELQSPTQTSSFQPWPPTRIIWNI